jgi:hypothetical protein
LNLQHAVSDLFSLYACQWCHIPAQPWYST